jgi:hypothetical protein
VTGLISGGDILKAGFIAAFAVLANSQVNFCLVPEVPFKTEKTGPRGLDLEQRPGPYRPTT